VITLKIRLIDDKQLHISGINPVLLDCLQSLPAILEKRDLPSVRKRLQPDPTTADKAANTEWQQTIAPDLRHLFVSAGETVLHDLAGLAPTPGKKRLHEVIFSVVHLRAWMSALNEARLILGEIYQITEEDMSAVDLKLDKPRDLALFRIHVFGYLLHRLVELEMGGQPSLDNH
jgi:hypothetical protein